MVLKKSQLLYFHVFMHLANGPRPQGSVFQIFQFIKYERITLWCTTRKLFGPIAFSFPQQWPCSCFKLSRIGLYVFLRGRFCTVNCGCVSVALESTYSLTFVNHNSTLRYHHNWQLTASHLGKVSPCSSPLIPDQCARTPHGVRLHIIPDVIWTYMTQTVHSTFTFSNWFDKLMLPFSLVCHFSESCSSYLKVFKWSSLVCSVSLNSHRLELSPAGQELWDCTFYCTLPLSWSTAAVHFAVDCIMSSDGMNHGRQPEGHLARAFSAPCHFPLSR